MANLVSLCISLLLMMPYGSGVAYPLYFSSVAVQPPAPTEADTITVRYSSYCSPPIVQEAREVTVTGNVVDVLIKVYCGGFAVAGLIDGEINVGKLAPGSYVVRYSVQAHEDSSVPYQPPYLVETRNFYVSAAPGPTGVVVTEFYHPVLGHYFMTSDPQETEHLKSHRQSGWIPTDEVFVALSIDTPLTGNTSTVCRFYGSVTPGPNSHFFTESADECAGLVRLQASTPPAVPRWNLETREFVVGLPQQDVCPPDFPQPVRRYYNNRASQNDANHRYVSKDAVAGYMPREGWIDEGVRMCARQ